MSDNKEIHSKINDVTSPGQTPKRRKVWPVALCLVGFAAGAAAVFHLFGSADTGTSAGAAPTLQVSQASPESGDAVYPVSMFEDGKARHFDRKIGDGVTVRYFLVKSSDGVIRAAFDACVVCWREGKGYFQKQDVMVCRNCGRRFLSTKINVVTGGCNPVPLTRNVENGNVVIRAQSFEEGKQLFSFGGGRS